METYPLNSFRQASNKNTKLCLGKLRFLNIVLDVAIRKKSSQTIQFLESSNSNFPETRYKILGKYF